MSIDTQLKQFKDAFNAELANVSNAETLEVVRVKYLGRKSAFQDILRNLKDMNDEERREAGQAANAVKEAMQAAIESKEAELERRRYDHLATDERVDISLPGFAWPKGHLHMTTRAIRDIQRIFERLGFTRVRYPPGRVLILASRRSPFSWNCPATSPHSQSALPV